MRKDALAVAAASVAVTGAVAAGSTLLGLATRAHADSWPYHDPRDHQFVEALADALGIDRVNAFKVAKETVCDELRHGWPAADLVDEVAATLELTGGQARVFTNLAAKTYCPDWRAAAPPPSTAPKPLPVQPAPSPNPHTGYQPGWKPALNAFAITFNGRITPTGN